MQGSNRILALAQDLSGFFCRKVGRRVCMKRKRKTEPSMVAGSLGFEAFHKGAAPQP